MSVTSMKSVLAMTLSAALLMSLAACGGSESGSSDAAGETSSEAKTGYDVSSVKKDDAIAALLPESVTKDGKLTVGMDTSYAPAEFLAEDGQTPIGYDVDLVKALANVFGLDADPQTANFDTIIPSVGSKYDVGISSFTVSPERMEAVDFVTFYKAGSTWVTRKDNPDNVDPTNLCGVKVAVQTGTSQEESVTAMSEQCKADGKDEIDILSSKLQTDVTTNVVTGKAAVFYADSPVAGYAVAQTDGELQTLGSDEGVTLEGAVVQKGDSATDQALQKAFQKLIDDGTYMKILKYWGVEGGAVDTAEINPSTDKS